MEGATGDGAPAPAPTIDLGDDILRTPIAVIDRDGRVVRVIRPLAR